MEKFFFKQSIEKLEKEMLGAYRKSNVFVAIYKTSFPGVRMPPFTNHIKLNLEHNLQDLVICVLINMTELISTK